MRTVFVVPYLSSVSAEIRDDESDYRELSALKVEVYVWQNRGSLPAHAIERVGIKYQGARNGGAI